MDRFTLYTDGYAATNPGRGGYGCIVLDVNRNILNQICGGKVHTTSNRMEIMGVLEGLKSIDTPSNIVVISDSQYVVNTINLWLKKWVAKGFEDKKNTDLWKEIWELMKKHNVQARWVKGHNGDKFNELADRLAYKGGQEVLTDDNGYNPEDDLKVYTYKKPAKKKAFTNYSKLNRDSSALNKRFDRLSRYD